MAQQRRIQLSTQHPTSTVCVLGTELSLDVRGSAPKDAVAFHVQGTPGVKLYVVHETQSVKLPSSVCRWPLAAGTEVLLAMDALSKDVGDEKVGARCHRQDPALLCTVASARSFLQVRISYFGEAGGVPVARAMLYLTCATWTWGPDGHGAILLVNCDRDDPKAEMPDNRDTAIRSYAGTSTSHTRNPPFSYFFPPKFSFLTPLSSPLPRPEGHVTDDSVALEEYKHVLGGSKLAYAVKPSRHQEESIFYVEGLAFPDIGFSGLVAFHVTLLESPEKGLLETPIFTDTVVFRVAPWIMTPNTAAPLEVFVCSVDDNEDFVAAVGAVAEKAKCPLTICPLPENRQDRWIQDEVEFGYVQAPHKTFPVVFDSPRDRGLKDFPVKRILVPNPFPLPSLAKPPEGASSLDSFGNLEVSPPVTVQGKEYPLGRILIGSSFPSPGGLGGKSGVQPLFPAPLPQNHPFLPLQGFRLLLASPSACYQLLKEKQEEGFGEAAMFEGLEKVPKPTINEILANEGLRKFNNYVQRCIDWNRDLLKQELGLSEQDIIDIPQLFILKGSRADALFPDMVNMLVLGRHLGIPKPFGPLVGGQCCLEERVRELLEPLGLTCTFIDDYFSYHVLSGEVHCGTNVRRKPFAFKWWHMVP
ncbi:PADI1 deiminase, partial [Ibidorhyncha struthersii]|nr:PADI1 deiminase [Ibidorhyncha struthersii]